MSSKSELIKICVLGMPATGKTGQSNISDVTFLLITEVDSRPSWTGNFQLLTSFCRIVTHIHTCLQTTTKCISMNKMVKYYCFIHNKRAWITVRQWPCVKQKRLPCASSLIRVITHNIVFSIPIIGLAVQQLVLIWCWISFSSSSVFIKVQDCFYFLPSELALVLIGD